MSRATTDDAPSDASHPPAPCNLMAFAAFAAAAVLFVLYFCIRYNEPYNGGAGQRVLFGLWGLYWLTGLAWGALRIRPRGHRTSLFNALMWATVPQAFFFVVFWGALLMETPAHQFGRTAAIAFFAGPVIAVALAFWSRRGLTFVLAQFFGPGGFALLMLQGG